MGKKNMKKINWKKIAAVGGVFLLGTVVGAIGGKKLLDTVIKNEDVGLTITSAIIDGKPGIRIAMACEKAGFELVQEMPNSVAKNGMKVLSSMIDGTAIDPYSIF